MLSLPLQTRGELVVMPDHDDPRRVYVALARPRLSTRTPERPSLRLLHWMATQAPRAGEREVGGHLFLEIEVEPTAAHVAAAGLAGLDVQPMPWVEAQAILQAQGADPITSEVSVVAGGRAAFAMRLSPQQVDRLAPQLRGETVAPLQVTWVGQVRARLPAAEIIATVDVTALGSLHATGSSTTIRDHVSTHARIEISGSTNPELEAALRAWALDALGERAERGETLLVRASAAEVVRWPLRLSSTLDLDPAQGRDVVTALALPPHELAARPPVRIQARGGFDGGVERVDVELREAGGEPVRVALSSEAAAWVEAGDDALAWRHRVVVGGAARPWSSWREAAGMRDLTIPVILPPPRTIEVLLAGLDLQTRWAFVRVELTASDAAGSLRSHVVELREGSRAGTWVLPSGTEGAAVAARTTLVSVQGLRVEQGPDAVEHDQVVVSDPFGRHRIGVTLVPVGRGWDQLALAMVDLRHEDGTWVHEQAAELRALSDFVQVDLPARAGGSRTLWWRVHASFTDGRFAQSPWQQSDAPLLAVALPAAPSPP